MIFRLLAGQRNHPSCGRNRSHARAERGEAAWTPKPKARSNPSGTTSGPAACRTRPDISHLTFEELLKSKSDLPIFRLPDGTVTDSLRQTFRVFLEENDLLIEPRTNQERTLCCLRHTYATFAIVYEGIDLHLLAKQMGTSIAMIEKHYSHLTPRLNAHKLAGGFRQRMMDLQRPIPWDDIAKEIKEAIY